MEYYKRGILLSKNVEFSTYFLMYLQNRSEHFIIIIYFCGYLIFSNAYSRYFSYKIFNT